MGRNNEYDPQFVAQTGPLNGQRWSIRAPIIVGREPTCQIVIPDRQVSRQHASLTPTPQGVLLQDLDSKNGTHRNGQVIHETVTLQDGDVIQIALAQQFIFLSSDATLPLDDEDIDLSLLRPIQPAKENLLRLEKKSRRVWIAGEEVLPPLSVSQFHLLEALYENQDRVVARKDLISAVWGKEQAVEVSEQALDALVRRLRDRLANIDPDHTFIVTVRGHGLRLDNPSSDAV
ncbi:MAG TPA: FHA domain-containing protein [Anaerolineales bacterium]|nr:FHA domain-containing protein [Anaerolineales bacterium]